MVVKRLTLRSSPPVYTMNSGLHTLHLYCFNVGPAELKFGLCCMLSVYGMFDIKAESWSCVGGWGEGWALSLSWVRGVETCTPSWSTPSEWPCRIPEPVPVFSLPSMVLLVSGPLSLCLCWSSPTEEEIPPTPPCCFFVPPFDRQLVTSCFSNDEKHVDISSQSLVVA